MNMTNLRGPRLISFLLNIFHLKGHVDIPSTVKGKLSDRGAPLASQRNSKFAQLPNEILLLISDHLDAIARASLIRTCRWFHNLLEWTLYRHMNVSYYHGDFGTNCWYRTLEERPDLIPFIRTYHGPIIPRITAPEPPPKRKFIEKISKGKKARSFGSSHTPITKTDAIKRAVTIFTQATNIEDLMFTDFHRWTADPLLEPIRAVVSTMSLNRLTTWCCEELTQVLSDQPELEELSLRWNNHGLDKLEKNHIPKLRSLRTLSPEAACLVPGRPVEQFHLSSAVDLDEQLFSRLSLSTRPIIEFSTHLISSWETERVRALLQALARNLPQLETLTITVGGSIPGQVIMDEIPSFKCLRYLTFLDAKLDRGKKNHVSSLYELTDPLQVPDHETVQKAPIQAEWDDIFGDLKALCPLLVYVRSTSSN